MLGPHVLHNFPSSSPAGCTSQHPLCCHGKGLYLSADLAVCLLVAIRWARGQGRPRRRAWDCPSCPPQLIMNLGEVDSPFFGQRDNGSWKKSTVCSNSKSWCWTWSILMVYPWHQATLHRPSELVCGTVEIRSVFPDVQLLKGRMCGVVAGRGQ